MYVTCYFFSISEGIKYIIHMRFLYFGRRQVSNLYPNTLWWSLTITRFFQNLMEIEHLDIHITSPQQNRFLKPLKIIKIIPYTYVIILYIYIPIISKMIPCTTAAHQCITNNSNSITSIFQNYFYHPKPTYTCIFPYRKFHIKLISCQCIISTIKHCFR